MAIQRWIGYCTNVHAGATLPQARENLTRYASGVRDILGNSQPLGVGLWLSASSAQTLLETRELDSFAGMLHENKLVPFTFNGFPYGDFHQDVVKHDVYLPTWWDEERLDYTKKLVRILDRLLPSFEFGSISTLPIAWSEPQPTEQQWNRAASHLIELARELEALELQTGRLIYLCIEPEPGCLLDTTDDIVEFFERRLFPLADQQLVCRYLRVCHDVCHAAVMFEEQQTVVEKYAAAGISIGKVQVSSAIEVSFDDDPGRTDQILHRLAQFAEDRYLHQTVARQEDGSTELFEDLPIALARAAQTRPIRQTWRIHFHVPVHLDQVDLLGTTQSHIVDCVAATAPLAELQHYEVETYAWGVLPEDLRPDDLSAGIAREISWLRTQFGPFER